MPDDTSHIIPVIPEAEAPDVVPAPPTNKREAGMLITDIGHDLIGREKAAARYDQRISRLRQKANKLEREKKNDISLRVARASVNSTVLGRWAMSVWTIIREKGLRTARFGTGEIRMRAIGKPTIRINDNDAFFEEIRRKRRATQFIRYPPPEPNIDALHDDVEFARTLTTVEVIDDTKIEIRPRHSETYILASIPKQEDGEFKWEIGPLKSDKKR